MFALALLLLPLSVQAGTLAPNSGDIELRGTATATITIGGEGCWSGYTWHTTYGGCRRRQLEQYTETAACPPGRTGQQTRTNSRYNYIAQGSNAVTSEPWIYGQWDDRYCGYVEPTRENSVLIDQASGGSFGANNTQVAYLLMQRESGRLWCQGYSSSNEYGGNQYYDYPSDGAVYFDTHKEHMATRCQINGSGVGATVLLEGSGVEGSGKSVRITVQSRSPDGCVYTLQRIGNPGPAGWFGSDWEKHGGTVRFC